MGPVLYLAILSDWVYLSSAAAGEDLSLSLSQVNVHEGTGSTQDSDDDRDMHTRSQSQPLDVRIFTSHFIMCKLINDLHTRIFIIMVYLLH